MGTNRCTILIKNIMTIETKYDPADIVWIMINNKPKELYTIVKKIHMPLLSPFTQSTSCCPVPNCVYALFKVHNNCELMTPDDIPELFNFLINNNYKIDTAITKMMNNSEVKMTNKLVCFITSL